MKPIIIKDNIYLKHNFHINSHPESKERLISIYSEIEPILDRFEVLKPKRAIIDDVIKVHTKKHYYKVRDASLNEEPLDADTLTSIDSFSVALYAAGAGKVAIDNIKSAKRAFCLVRPPGHHATQNKAMGFCLFNNIAITAKYAQSVGYKRVFIIDFDVHHGNGTQDIFYSDSSVFYFSTHQAFAYPGTGTPNEIGIGDGKGFTYNAPLMPDSTDKELLEVYTQELPELIDSFNPDIVLVSAGYDLHQSDPLASLDITFEGIEKMVKIILKLADDKPVVFFLEGGYDTKALAINVKNTLTAMLD